MTWLTTETAPKIDSFGAAEYHYNNFTPIRGRDIKDTGAALGYRRDWRHKSLHKLNDDTYGFRLYDTDVVRIHRDNSITIDLSYPSQTTNKWAEHWLYELTGGWIVVNSDHNMIYFREERVPDDQLAVYRREVKASEQKPYLYYFTDDSKFRLEPHYRMRWQKIFVVDPAPRYVKRVDKSAANDSRKSLQPFLKYLKIFASSPLPSEAVRELNREYNDSNWNKSIVAQLVDEPDNEELWAYAAAHFHNHDYNWRTQQTTAVLTKMRDIKTALYARKYEIDGLNGYKQLPIGVCKSSMLYTQSFVDQHQ